MYVAAWFRVAQEEEEAPTLLDLVVSFYSTCGVAIWSAWAAISSPVMDFFLMIVTLTFQNGSSTSNPFFVFNDNVLNSTPHPKPLQVQDASPIAMNTYLKSKPGHLLTRIKKS